jgi:hypothetical protein
MNGDGVQELGPYVRLEHGCAPLDQTQAEVDVTEKTPFLGWLEGRAASEFRRAADVVEKGRGEEEVGAKPRVQLGGLAADRRHSNGVLEQPSGVTVMTIGCRR